MGALLAAGPAMWARGVLARFSFLFRVDFSQETLGKVLSFVWMPQTLSGI